MAQVLWLERCRVAGFALLASMAALAFLDLLTRGEGDPSGASVGYLGVALAVAALPAAFVDWELLPPTYRLTPAFAATLALLAAVFWAGTPSTGHATSGLAAAAILILAYVGFVMPPGAALLFSPLLVMVLLVAHRQEEIRINLAVPLVIVPAAALLGEMISSLVNQSDRSTDRSIDHSITHRAGLNRLEDVLRRFRRPETLNDAAHEVAQAAIELFGVERATVVLRDVPDGLVSVTVGPSTDEIPDADTARLVVETIGGTRPQIVPTGDHSKLLVLPLHAGNQSTGAVVVHPLITDDPEYSLDLARLFGAQIGLAIEHLFVINELRRATTRDELTGIGNRKHADSLVASLEEGDAIILLDLDGFKEVNDTLGHAAGDLVLQELSAHLRHCLRDSDTSARLGGDEFMIVARRAFADPLAVADRVLVGWAHSGRSTTLSAGVALHEPDTNPTDTLSRADQALYQAKAAGKNRAHMWFPPRPGTAAFSQSVPGSPMSPGITTEEFDVSGNEIMNGPEMDGDTTDRRTQGTYPGFHPSSTSGASGARETDPDLRF